MKDSDILETACIPVTNNFILFFAMLSGISIFGLIRGNPFFLVLTYGFFIHEIGHWSVLRLLGYETTLCMYMWNPANYVRGDIMESSAIPVFLSGFFFSGLWFVLFFGIESGLYLSLWLAVMDIGMLVAVGMTESKVNLLRWRYRKGWKGR